MDPTFGSQELLETLSQASSTAKSRQSRESRSKSSSRGGSSNSTLTSTHTNPVEDAYRRIGQGLSQRASGETTAMRPQLHRARLGTHPCTSFEKYSKSSHPHPTQGGPNTKIPKLHSVGGTFHQDATGANLDGDAAGGNSNNKKPSQKLLKKITMQAKETFHKYRRQQKAGYLKQYAPSTNNHSVPGTISTSNSSSTTSGPASLDKYGRIMEQQQQLMMQQQHQQQQSMSMPPDPKAYARQKGQQQQQPQSQPQPGEPQPKGLLSAVLEGGSDTTYESESVHSLPTIDSHMTGVSRNSMGVATNTAAGGAKNFHQYQVSGSIGGAAQQYHQQQQILQQQQHPLLGSGPNALQPALHFATPRGRCLTQPPEPVANEGLDNVEGNIILHQSDIMVVPSRATKSDPQTTTNHHKGLEFHVQSLLGQGTFAQVFSCYEARSQKHVALKIIKNKPAFTKQAAVEIEVFQALAATNIKNSNDPPDPAAEVGGSTPASPHMVHLLSSFMFKSHLCLVFECLGMNLYEVLKRRQFRGLPLQMVRTLVKQAIEGVKELAGKTIVHCDLKPENILLVGGQVEKDVLNAGDHKHPPPPPPNSDQSPQTIKLIDFGSACFEGYSAHTYIQSRFYRSPEVLMGLPYDSAIDIWSLGCVAAELFLGLPILPGVHEHDQCGRIVEMINPIPDWMLEQGSKANKYFVKYMPRPGNTGDLGKASTRDDGRPMMPQWRMKTQDEYIKSLTQNEIRKKGGLAKLEKQPANRYFKRTKLCDIIMLHGQHGVDDKELLGMFVHFLYGVLDPDPWKRWTAYQASQHPFITGMSGQLRKKTPETRLDYKEENQANCNFDIYWQPPWDPGICRRKLLNVQRMREKQNAQRRNYAQAAPSPSMNSLNSRGMVPDSPSVGHMSVDGKNSPPSEIADKEVLRQQQAQAKQGMTAGSLPAGGVASSMNAIGNAAGQRGGNDNTRTEQLMNPPPGTGKSGFMGPQSYTALGNVDDAPQQADFAYALQRPGNVPALSSSVASAAGGVPVNSHMRQQQYHQHQQQHQQYQQHPQQQQQHYRLHGGSMRDTMQGSLPKYNNGGNAGSVNSLQGGYSNQAPGMVGGGGYQGLGGSLSGMSGHSSSGRYDNQGGGVQYLAQQRELQKQQQQQQQQGRGKNQQQMEPQIMSAYDHQMLIEQQQKQLLALQQQHQQQLAALQQQQQLAFQQQQQQLLGQQYGTTGNGYYYVTSADGTPMMVQGGAPMGTSYDGSQGGSYRGDSQGGSYRGMPQQHMGYGDNGSRPGSMRDHQGRMSGSHRGSYR